MLLYQTILDDLFLLCVQDVSGWQGDSQSMPGSFSGLGFQQPSSQDNPPGVSVDFCFAMVKHYQLFVQCLSLNCCHLGKICMICG